MQTSDGGLRRTYEGPTKNPRKTDNARRFGNVGRSIADYTYQQVSWKNHRQCERSPDRSIQKSIGKIVLENTTTVLPQNTLDIHYLMQKTYTILLQKTTHTRSSTDFNNFHFGLQLCILKI